MNSLNIGSFDIFGEKISGSTAREQAAFAAGIETARQMAMASAARPSFRPDEPAHRPVADRRAAVEALLTECLSDREIARRVKVSPSTVSAVRRARADAVSSIEVNV